MQKSRYYMLLENFALRFIDEVHLLPSSFLPQFYVLWHRISYYNHYKVWNEITYLFPNFDGATVGIYEWISNFIVQVAEHMIIYTSGDWSSTLFVKAALGDN